MASKKIKLISNIATIVVIIFFLFITAVSLIPKVMGLSGFVVESDSMAPTFTRGDVVFAEKIEFDDIRVGDILTFESKDTTKRFTHRVYELDNNEQLIYTKGDANNTQDPSPIAYKFVKGRVRYVLPFVGYVIKALNSTAGRIVAGTLLVLWLAIEIEIYSIHRKELSKTDEEKNN